ncbi:MAG: hypothetical protein ACK4N4_01275 [Burkholderiales bacterium]
MALLRISAAGHDARAPCKENLFYSRIWTVSIIGKKILFLALLLLIPTQGIAASLSHVSCFQPADTEYAASHAHASDASAPLHHHDQNQGDSSAADYAGHLSCHQVSSGIPSAIVMAFADDLPAYHAASFSPPRPFFPEQPQRPPRS